MKKFQRHLGVAAPLLRDNVDTDAIIPSVEMKRVSKHGLGEGLFASWRYLDRGAKTPNPAFVLNRAEYANASVLLTGRNFGCGSSREHAVWALAEFGIRVVVAESFGAIFRANCIANGILPVDLPGDAISRLATWVEQDPQNHRLEFDLERRRVTAGPGTVLSFEIADSDADMLLKGMDAVSLTLRLDDQIRAFEERDRLERPWIYL